MMITIHNNNEDYSLEEVAILKQEFDALEEKAKGGKLTLEDTRIRVAGIRYMREDNFKIVIQPARTKKDSSEIGKKKYSVLSRKKKENSILENMILTSQLLHRKEKGEILTEEEQKILDNMQQDNSILKL